MTYLLPAADYAQAVDLLASQSLHPMLLLQHYIQHELLTATR